MYLAEDRVRNSRNAFLCFSLTSAIRFCAGNWCRSAVGRGYFTMSSRRTASPILRIRWGFMCPNVVQRILADMTGSGSRAGLATPEVAQRLVLRRDTRHSQVPLHIPLFALLCAQVLDSRRAPLSDIQSCLFLVRPRALLSSSSFWSPTTHGIFFRATFSSRSSS